MRFYTDCNVVIPYLLAATRKTKKARTRRCLCFFSEEVIMDLQTLRAMLKMCVVVFVLVLCYCSCLLTTKDW